jgi:ketopantoate reductase
VDNFRRRDAKKKDGARAEPIEGLAYMLNTSGLTAKVVDDIHSTEWTKLLGAVPGLS